MTTEEILSRIKKNVSETDPLVARKDLEDIIISMVALFVETEPRLIDPNVSENMKGVFFFKSLLSLGAEGATAWALQKFNPSAGEKFAQKILGFNNFKDALMRYTK